MPTFRHGKSSVILFNNYNVSEYLNNASSVATVETAETTTFGSSAKSYITGLQDSGVTLSGMFEGGASGTDAIFTGVLGSDAVNIVSFYPEGVSTVGNRVILAQGRLVSYETTSPVGDVVSCSIDLQTTGGRNSGVMLVGSNITATGSATSVDNSASSANGGVAHLHVPANSRNGTIVVKVQHSSDNSTWVDLITFATVPTSTLDNERVEVSGTVNRYTRANYTVSGSTGSADVYVAFARR